VKCLIGESGQVRQLKAAGCEKIFREKITGTTADRLQLGKLMKKLAPGDVITPAVDRLSRDTTDLLASVIGGGRPDSDFNASA
jgi:DNA invertase Pin-like site-specific DNA recombinase